MSAITWNLLSDSDRTNNAVFLIDLQSQTFCYVNDYACEKLGYERDELLQMGILDIDPLIDDASLQKMTEQMIRQGFSLQETYYLTKAGRFFPVEVSGNVFDYQGARLGLFVARDLTERNYKEAEKRHLINILEESADFIGSADMEGKLLYHNPAARRMMGFAEDADLSTLSIVDVCPQWAFQLMCETVIPTIMVHGTWQGEGAILHTDGREIPVSQTVVLHRDADGKPLFMSTIMHDLTERKQREAQLSLLNYAFDYVDEAIYLIDENAQFVQVNEKACRDLGYTREELLQLKIFDIDPDYTPQHWKQRQEDIAQGILSTIVETRHRTKNGHIFPIEVRASHIQYQGQPYDIAMVRDVSEREQRKAQFALLDYAFNHVDEGVFLINSDAQFVQVNEKACQSLGYLPEELLSMGIFDIDPDFIHENWQKLLAEYEKGMKSITLETRHRSKEGRIFPVEVRGHYIVYQGQKYSFAIVRDITERKAAEKQLTLLNYALDQSKEEVWLIDENAKFHYVNQAACRSIGVTYQEMLQLSVPDIKPDYSLEQWQEVWQCTKIAKGATFETRHKSKEGNVFPVEVNASHFELDGQHYSLALSHNITERKAAEKQLTLLNYALDHVGESVWLIDETGNFHYINQEACHSVGYTREEMLQLKITNIGADVPIETWNAHWQALKEQKTLRFEVHHKTKEGDIFPVEVNANYFEFDGKSYNLALSHDITERKQIQQALQHSQSLLNDAQRIAHIGSWEVNFVNGVLSWSDETFRIWEVDKSQFGATVEAFLETVHPEDREKVATAYQASISNKSIYQIEHRLLFADGRVKYISERGEPFCDAEGNVIRFVGTAMDITERHHTEETLKFVAQRGWKNRNDSFLVALTQYLAQIFAVDYVIVNKIGLSPTESETVALSVKGEMQPNIHYSLQGTPCNNVMIGKICCYPENVQQLFPDDALLVELQIESYVGLPLWDTAGKVIGLIAVMDTKPLKAPTFISAILQLVATSTAAELERQHSEQRLQDSQHFLTQIINTLADPVFVKDREHRWVLMNQTMCDFMGQSSAHLLGKSDYDFFPPHQADVFWEKDELVFTNGGENSNEEEFTNAAGELRMILTKKTCYTDHNGQQFLVGIITDITERKRMEEILQQREQEFRVLVETSPAPIFRYDKNCQRVYVNPAVERMAGKTAAELLNGTPTDGRILTQQEGEKLERMVRQVFATAQAAEGEIECKTAAGELRFYYNRYAPELDADGNVTSVILVAHDITERKQIEQQMFYQARYDSLTGLPNRRLFSHRLSEEIAQAELHQHQVALLFIDLDRFKEVNDTLGHNTGDHLLADAAQRIQLCVREADTVARLGGDEFVVILSEINNLAPVKRIAEAIIVAINKPFQLSGYSAYVSASIGGAIYPQDAKNAETLMSCADQAMYSAKESGRNRFNFFTPSLQEQVQQRLQLINSLQDALEENQFEVYYQPIIESSSGKVVKAEALLRWQHPTLGMVSPDKFIPLAEETDLIQDIGNWVFCQAADTVKYWHEQSAETELRKISINLSPRQLSRGNSDQLAIAYLDQIDLNAAHIVLEITEGLLLDNSPSITQKLERLSKAGIELSLDDFGTGYSAMAYLKKFAIDYLKIDRSFVQELETNANDRAITEAIVMMAHRLGLKVVAEGVETEGQRALLAAVGCEYLQGYLYAEPMPRAEFFSYLGFNLKMSH